MKWRRLRKWAKWTCTLAAGAAVALAVFSRFSAFEYVATTNSGDTEWHADVRYGLVSMSRFDGLRSQSIAPASGWGVLPFHGWYWGYSGEGAPSSFVASWHGGVLYGHGIDQLHLGVSVMYPVVLTLIPASLLWYADRRRFGPGLCPKCGYDRRGLAADAKCPECGTVPAPAAK